MITLLLCVVASFADPTDMQALDKLVEIRRCVEAVQVLEAHGVNLEESVVVNLLKEAEQVSGGKVKTYEELRNVTGNDNPPPTAIEKAKGFLTFINIIWVLAAMLGIGAIIWLFGLYFVTLILMVPPRVWEIVCYAACAFLILGGLKIDPAYGLSMALPGCLGLIGCLSLTHNIRFAKLDTSYLSTYAWLLTVVWGVVAVLYGSHVIGFFAVVSLLSALGFVMGMIPGVIYMGFDDEDFIPRTTISAGLITALWVALQISGKTDPRIDVFREGMMVWGTFVYFIGLLIWSSKWCCARNVLKYFILQLVTVASGCLALYLGSVFQLDFLLGIGGCVFYIYLLEKYYEIPWEGAGWAWSTLGLAGIIYGFAVFAKAHPTYFVFWQ